MTVVGIELYLVAVHSAPFGTDQREPSSYLPFREFVFDDVGWSTVGTGVRLRVDSRPTVPTFVDGRWFVLSCEQAVQKLRNAHRWVCLRVECWLSCGVSSHERGMTP